MKPRIEPATFSLGELAAHVGWPEQLVRSWSQKGMLPEPLDREPDGDPQWSRESIERWLAEGRS